VQTARVEAEVGTGHAVIEPDLDNPTAATLWVDGAAQSYVDLADPTNLLFEYIQHMAAVLETALPAGRVDVLHLGGGGCTLPRMIAATRPGSRQRVAEIDGALVELVRAALPLPPAYRVTISTADARTLLGRTRQRSLDAVVVDVFTAARVPAALTTAEFFTIASRALRPGGVLVFNLVDGHRLAFARALVATARSSFAEVALAAEPGVWRGRRYSNLVLAATTGSLPIAELSRRLASGPFPARLVHGVDLGRFAERATIIIDATAVDSPAPPPRAHGLRG
jgi:spermidine synthase